MTACSPTEWQGGQTQGETLTASAGAPERDLAANRGAQTQGGGTDQQSEGEQRARRHPGEGEFSMRQPLGSGGGACAGIEGYHGTERGGEEEGSRGNGSSPTVPQAADHQDQPPGRPDP